MTCTWPRYNGLIEEDCAVDFQLSLESEGVGSAYPDQPLAATADESVGTVLQLLRAQRTGAVLICEGSKLVGIFTERDALKQMASGADLSAPVRDVMSSPPATIASSATVGEAIRMMAEGNYRHLPIVDKSKSRPAFWPSTASSIIWWTIFRKLCTTCRPIRRPRREHAKEHNECR